MDFDIDKISSDLVLTTDYSQDVELLLDSKKGSWYEHPDIGIDIKQYQNASVNKLSLEREIKEQLKNCGIENVTFEITFANGKLNIKFYGTT